LAQLEALQLALVLLECAPVFLGLALEVLDLVVEGGEDHLAVLGHGG
jgi:hypothetical protein